jgi:Arc/MetJ-type ribon-helix-helix transcriptional regulator
MEIPLSAPTAVIKSASQTRPEDHRSRVLDFAARIASTRVLRAGLANDKIQQFYWLKGKESMKTLSIDLPDKLAAEIDAYVKAGLFRSEPDAVLAAMSEFVRRNRVDLVERFAREDIEWAKKEALASE